MSLDHQLYRDQGLTATYSNRRRIGIILAGFTMFYRIVPAPSGTSMRPYDRTGHFSVARLCLDIC
ncbi:hypothetical protein BC629DRAFT_1544672 [Irpex lacteus]|nr:hypothetical protein BC629DRAFT_1544672 [Irpex lacteus]